MDVIERLMREKPGTNSLSLFRKVLKSDTLGDHHHGVWVRTGIIEPSVYTHVEELLNETALERIRKWA